MGLRHFKCSCGYEWDRILKSMVTSDPCKVCAQVVPALPPVGSKIKITEKVGKYWNKNLEVGIKEKMAERSTEHMRKYEMPEIIGKFGIDTLKNHPLIKDGRIRKRGEV